MTSAAKGGQSSRKRSHASSSSTTTASGASSGSASSITRSRNKHTLNNNGSNNNSSITKRIAKFLSLSSSTLQATVVLCFAILSGVAWNAWDDNSTASASLSNRDDPQIRRFLASVCLEANVFCHPSLVHHRRSQVALRPIARGERVLEIPRSMQIWDLDALRNGYLRHTFMNARHKRTNNPVDSAAYLSIYLALLNKEQLRFESSDSSKDDSNNDNNNDGNDYLQEESATPTNPNNKSPKVLQYLQECMPTIEDLDQFHPLFWNQTQLMELLPPHTATFGVVKAYRDMVQSEYQAFVSISKRRMDRDLNTILSEREYTAARVLVLSRSFGTGPLPMADSLSDSSLTRAEMEYYKTEFGIDLSRGSYAMVPILDFYDHHATPNVDYAYSSERGVFAIRATGEHGIGAGHEVVDSYGKFTDSHLFAKFGFVNGDGSEHSQANLATKHLVLDMDLKQQFSHLPFASSRGGNQKLPESIQKALDKQRQGVKQYLRFDDGYEHCVLASPGRDDTISDDNKDQQYSKDAFELKRLKAQHLAKIANHVKRWHLVLLPRAQESKPARSSNIPITLTPPKMSKENANIFHRKEYQLVAATCRLISLTHEDYNGQAVELLKKNLNNNSFLLEPQRDKILSNRDSLAAALEFRTHFCLARLASEALQRFSKSTTTSSTEILSTMESRVARLNRQAYQSKEWAAAHLQLSEMQTLELLRGVSFSAAQQYEDLRNKSPAFSIRGSLCPDI